MESIDSAIKQERLEEESKNEVQLPVTTTTGYSPEREVKREIMSSDELISPQNSTRIVDPADMNNSMSMSIDMNADTQGIIFHILHIKILSGLDF